MSSSAQNTVADQRVDRIVARLAADRNLDNLAANEREIALDFIRNWVVDVLAADAASEDDGYRECQGCGFEWFEGNVYAPEAHRSDCPINNE